MKIENFVFEYLFIEFERYISRRKLYPNINYQGLQLLVDVAQLHKASYIYVGEASRTEQFKGVLSSNGRDFDVLQESLGIVL